MYPTFWVSRSLSSTKLAFLWHWYDFNIKNYGKVYRDEMLQWLKSVENVMYDYRQSKEKAELCGCVSTLSAADSRVHGLSALLS